MAIKNKEGEKKNKIKDKNCFFCSCFSSFF
jgi:hypothetical protein